MVTVTVPSTREYCVSTHESRLTPSQALLLPHLYSTSLLSSVQSQLGIQPMDYPLHVGCRRSLIISDMLISERQERERGIFYSVFLCPHRVQRVGTLCNGGLDCVANE
jgi:hypothetical protein